MQGRDLRRVILLAVSVLVAVAALLGAVLLLGGGGGDTEGRVLGTALVLAAHGLLMVPATSLLDRGRARPLAIALLVAAVIGAVAWSAFVWSDDDELGRVVGTTSVAVVIVAQVAGLVARRRDSDPRSVGLLFTASCALGGAAALIALVAIWGDVGDDGLGRLLGALLVADAGTVGLQPLLARAGAPRAPARLRLTMEGGGVREVEQPGADLGAAVAGAIRAAEAAGGRVRGVEVLDRGPAQPSGSSSKRGS